MQNPLSSIAGSVDETASDDELDWEEIEVAVPGQTQELPQEIEQGMTSEPGPSGLQTSRPQTGAGNIEITIKRNKPRVKDETRK